MPKLYLLIGGNQGDRRQMITQATDLIQQRIGSVVACSPIYETAPWGLFSPDETPQGFYNQALLVETPLSPHIALKEALDIEHQLGRRRKKMDNIHTPVFDQPPKELSFPATSDVSPQDFLNPSKEGTAAAQNSRFYSSRPIDIDLIFYDHLVVDTPDLILPHPRMHLRRFVLEPLCSIAPDYIHPIFNKSLTELLDECTDTSSCTPCC